MLDIVNMMIRIHVIIILHYYQYIHTVYSVHPWQESLDIYQVAVSSPIKIAYNRGVDTNRDGLHDGGVVGQGGRSPLSADALTG